MIGYFRRWREEPLRRVAAALDAHARFEAAHVERLTALLSGNKYAAEQHRTVPLEKGKSFVRPLGHYDLDQRIERVVGEVTRAYATEGRKPPRRLRAMVEEALG